MGLIESDFERTYDIGWNIEGPFLNKVRRLAFDCGCKYSDNRLKIRGLMPTRTITIKVTGGFLNIFKAFWGQEDIPTVPK